MKQIKHLVMAFAAVCLTVGFTSCEKEVEKIVEKPVEVEKVVEKEVEKIVEVPQDNNWSRYQAIVTADVKSQKKHDKAILLVAFGSTWDQAYEAFDTYKQVVVQSLQVIPGEEYRRVRDTYVKDFMNNRNGDFTDAYMKSLDLNVVVGTPLMAEESDAENLATVLNEEADVKAAVADGIVAFMGHGNPEGYDYYGGNIRYIQLEEAIQTYRSRILCRNRGYGG